MSAKYALPVVALAFATWAVYLGGLASLQQRCDTNDQNTYAVMEQLLPCSKVYRYYWFIMSWEFVVIAITAFAAITGKLASMRTALVGLWAISTLLFINASNTFLDTLAMPTYGSGTARSRARTTAAGAVMTAAIDAIAVLLVGWECEACSHPTSRAAATADEKAPPV